MIIVISNSVQSSAMDERAAPHRCSESSGTLAGARTRSRSKGAALVRRVAQRDVRRGNVLLVAAWKPGAVLAVEVGGGRRASRYWPLPLHTLGRGVGTVMLACRADHVFLLVTFRSRPADARPHPGSDTPLVNLRRVDGAATGGERTRAVPSGPGWAQVPRCGLLSPLRTRVITSRAPCAGRRAYATTIGPCGPARPPSS